MKKLLLAILAIFACNFTVLPCHCAAQVNEDEPTIFEKLVAAATADQPGLAEELQQKRLARARAVDPAKEKTKEIYVVLKKGVDPLEFAQQNGLKFIKSSPASTGRNSHVFAVADVESAALKTHLLSTKNLVKGAYVNEIIPVTLNNVPNDPYFASNAFDGQWAMNHRFRSTGVDSELLGAWSQGYWANGVVVGIVDGGVELGHPDLAPAAAGTLHWDFINGDSDPSPSGTDDNHGTSVAGIAVARANNGIGIAGAAGQATFIGIRAIGGGASIQQIADAIVHANGFIDVKNHSWGLSQTVPAFTQFDAWRFAFSTSNAPIQVKAAGNSRLSDAKRDAGKEHLNNSDHILVVGALDDSGRFAFYSSFGAPLICCAVGGNRSLTSTDRTGTAGYNSNGSGPNYSSANGLPSPFDYTSRFDGTSAAAPLVSGMIALAKEANPLINAENIGHLIVRSCDIVDASDNTVESDNGWRNNGAGFAFNQNYGFGKLNAAKLVSESQKFSGSTGAGLTFSTNIQDLTIPDSGSARGFISMPSGRSGKVTELYVIASIIHPRRGDLSCFITSPSGFRSRLFIDDLSDTGSNIGDNFYPFRSMAFWGEDYEGTWEIEFVDNRTGFGGFVDQFFLGTLLSEPVFINTPTNDDLENAIELNSLEPDTGSNVNATTEPYESDVSQFNTRRSVWWKGTAAITGFLNVDTFGSDFDTVLHVYRSPTGSTEDLVLLDDNDDFGGNLQSFVRVPVVAGDEIAIRVAGFGGNAGSIQVTACGIGPKILVAGNELIVRGGNDDDDIFVSQTGGDTFVEIDGVLQSYPGTYDVTVLGFDGNDTILSSLPGIVMNGMNGNDTITYSGSGTSELIGGNGDDTIRGGSGPDVISGGAGDDLIIGRAGNDTMYGGTGDDEMRGISGRNLISGGSGNNELFGGTGPDEIVGGTGDDVIFGGNGVDEIRGGAGLNVIDGGLASDNIIGGSDRDIIRGGPGNDTIYGLAGDDELLGDAGSDEIIGGPGNDLILGGPGLDRLFGQAGDDVLLGEVSADFLVGGGGNDELDGGSGPDELFGGGGSDVLTGGDGFDALHGGQGNDTATDEGEAAETSIEN